MQQLHIQVGSGTVKQEGLSHSSSSSEVLLYKNTGYSGNDSLPCCLRRVADSLHKTGLKAWWGLNIDKPAKCAIPAAHVWSISPTELLSKVSSLTETVIYFRWLQIPITGCTRVNRTMPWRIEEVSTSHLLLQTQKKKTDPTPLSETTRNSSSNLLLQLLTDYGLFTCAAGEPQAAKQWEHLLNIS